jgi:hypothetical protein
MSSNYVAPVGRADEEGNMAPSQEEMRRGPAEAVAGTLKRGVTADQVEQDRHQKGCCYRCVHKNKPEAPREFISDGRVMRLNVGCEHGGPMINDEDCKVVPFYLKKKGLTEEQWQTAMKELRSVDCFWGQGPMARCILCPFGACFAFIYLGFFLMLPCLFASLTRMMHMKMDKKLRRWQAHFNDVLMPLGMFCKTQSELTEVTTAPVNGNGGKRSRWFARWVAFALDEKEIENLKNDPHVKGSLRTDCAMCGLMTDEDCCMHYW